MDANAVTVKPKSSSTKKIVIIVLVVLTLILCCCSVVGYIFWKSADDAAKALQKNLPGQIDNLINNAESYTVNKVILFSSSLPQAQTPTPAPLYPADNPEIYSRKVSGNFAYTLLSAYTDGKNYVLTLKVENLGSNSDLFLAGQRLTLEDGTGQAYGENLLYSLKDVGTGQDLNRSVPAGGQITGMVVYSVPVKPAKLNLVVNNGFGDSGSVSFTVV